MRERERERERKGDTQSFSDVTFFFRELFKKSLWRLHGLEWSKRPWHWGHVYLGPFECFSKLHKLAYRWTKCGSSSSGPDTWLWRYIQGRYLEWPNMLSFKLVYLWKTIRTVIYQPQWLFDFTSENIFLWS